MSQRFEHCFFNYEQLVAVTIDDKRYYELPNGTLAKSVTTQIGDAMDKSHLHAWRERIGHEEALKITTQAANRGTAIHNICEHYLLNEQSYPKNTMPANIQSFKQIRPYLDKNLGKIYGIEVPLYSYELKAAGRTDCIAEWNGIPSVIDFKTSRKIKKEEWIQNYFYQATCYAMMMEERTGMHIPQLVILISVDHEDPQVFIKNTIAYQDKVREIFK